MNPTLEEKENLAKQTIAKELKDARNPIILFEGTIGSLLILHLLRQVNDGRVAIPVLHIDTSVEFKEIYQYIEKMRKLWGFRLIMEKNEGALKTLNFGEDREKCCEILKNFALAEAIKKYDIDKVFAFQDKQIKTNMESSKLLDERVIRYPIYDFCEEDIWAYIKKYNLPYSSLYDKGYKNILCIPCTNPVKQKDEPLEKKEEEEIKKRLKALGYM